MLEDVFAKLPADAFSFGLNQSIGTSDKATIIVAEPISVRKEVHVKIGTDRFGDADVARLQRLRFAISSAHARELVNDESKLSRFPETCHDALRTHAEGNIPELSVSLLGNAFLEKFDEIRYGGVRFFVDYAALEIETLQKLTKLAKLVSETLSLASEALDAFASEVMDWSEGEAVEYDF